MSKQNETISTHLFLQNMFIILPYFEHPTKQYPNPPIKIPNIPYHKTLSSTFTTQPEYLTPTISKINHNQNHVEHHGNCLEGH
jgi:hypothetical protein